jgi:hypothetical protein
MKITVRRPWSVEQGKQIVVVDPGLIGGLQHRPRGMGRQPRLSPINGLVINDPTCVCWGAHAATPFFSGESEHDGSITSERRTPPAARPRSRVWRAHSAGVVWRWVAAILEGSGKTARDAQPKLVGKLHYRNALHGRATSVVMSCDLLKACHCRGIIGGNGGNGCRRRGRS